MAGKNKTKPLQADICRGFFETNKLTNADFADFSDFSDFSDFANFANQHNCIIGICDALPLTTEKSRLSAAKTPFVTPNIEKRINPTLALPTAKSVIVLGKPYLPSPHKNLSSLGCGTDYHVTIKNLLKKLLQLLDCKNLNCKNSVKSVIMVDSGNLAERAFAVKAGLGFWGRNNMVISPKLGSFFNIGLLIVDIPLPTTPATAAISECPQNCNRCIQACPTNALKPYFLDVSLCTSYITQKKGTLTEPEQTLIGDQLFGCDICQLCCPFNKVDKTSAKNTDIISDILNMQQKEFDQQFGKTALAWRGLTQLQRNANIIAGNKNKS
ncbi:MAG: DUF1730 domain-containing protein [Defluviitaleaceae bacterium]|nr:DUF1730 domain-containing protein [Defluviitaleaceae bacterium]